MNVGASKCHSEHRLKLSNAVQKCSEESHLIMNKILPSSELQKIVDVLLA